MGHFGSLSKTLLIHLNFYKNERCVFLFDTILCNQETKDFIEGFASRVKDFAEVITYSDIVFADETSTENVRAHINDYFDKLLTDNNIDLLSEEKIYTMFDTFNAFAAFCLMNNVPITFVDAFGVLGKCRYKLNGARWVHYDELLSSLGALGYGCKNEHCKFLYKDLAVQLIEGEKINFDSLQKNLDKNATAYLLNLYGFDNEDSSAELCDLVVFSSGWIMGDKKIDRAEYFYYYRLLLDFFGDSGNKILLKPHPNINITQEEADKYFHNSFVLPNYFPSEFIPFVNKFQVRQVLATSGSGVPKDIYACKYFIAFEIFYETAVFKRLYFALQLEKFLQPIYNKFFHHGMHNKFVWGLQDNIFSKSRLRSVWASLNVFEPNSITIIDNYLWNGPNDKEKLVKALRSLNNNAMIIFLDSKDTCNYCFEDYKEGAAYIKTIHFVKESSEKHTDNEIEKIHVFCKDINIIKLLANFKYREYMSNTNSLYYSC